MSRANPAFGRWTHGGATPHDHGEVPLRRRRFVDDPLPVPPGMGEFTTSASNQARTARLEAGTLPPGTYPAGPNPRERVGGSWDAWNAEIARKMHNRPGAEYWRERMAGADEADRSTGAARLQPNHRPWSEDDYKYLIVEQRKSSVEAAKYRAMRTEERRRKREGTTDYPPVPEWARTRPASDPVPPPPRVPPLPPPPPPPMYVSFTVEWDEAISTKLASMTPELLQAEGGANAYRLKMIRQLQRDYGRGRV